MGARWGIGHSTGLLLVGIVLIVATLHSDIETIDVPKPVSKLFESMVGVFMILLGVWGIRRAKLKRSKEYDTEEVLTLADGGVVGEETEISANAENVLEVQQPDSRTSTQSVDIPELESGVDPTEVTPSDVPDEIDEENGDHHTTASNTPPQTCCGKISSKLSARTMALCAGILHGLAGPGGVLGVSAVCLFISISTENMEM